MSELARMTGLARQSVFEFYHDKNKAVKFETLNKICWALECKVEDILEYVPDKETP